MHRAARRRLRCWDACARQAWVKVDNKEMRKGVCVHRATMRRSRCGDNAH